MAPHSMLRYLYLIPRQGTRKVKLLFCGATDIFQKYVLLLFVGYVWTNPYFLTKGEDYLNSFHNDLRLDVLPLLETLTKGKFDAHNLNLRLWERNSRLGESCQKDMHGSEKEIHGSFVTCIWK